jgi:hypothetical protein
MGMDWRRAPGPAEILGGAALWRRAALVSAGLFDETLDAGEDPELSIRVRARGGKLLVRDDRMASHDLDITTFRGYWRRALSVGRSKANVAWRHPKSPVARRRLAEPFLGISAALAVAGVSVAIGGALGATIGAGVAAGVLFRRACLDSRDGLAMADAAAHALHVYAVKVPVALGALRRLASLALEEDA